MFAASRNRNRPHAFTLIEVLIVVSIMAVLLSMAAVAAGNMIDSIRMRDAIETVRAQFENARQTASTQNTPVIIRLYQEPAESMELGAGTGPQWNSLEFGTADVVLDPASQKYKNPEASNFEIPLKSLGPIQRLPTGYIFHSSDAYSTLLGSYSPLKVGSTKGADGVNRKYISFTCLPDQRTNLPTTRHWTLTIVKASDLSVSPSALPANYITLELDPTTARIRVYQPE